MRIIDVRCRVTVNEAGSYFAETAKKAGRCAFWAKIRRPSERQVLALRDGEIESDGVERGDHREHGGLWAPNERPDVDHPAACRAGDGTRHPGVAQVELRRGELRFRRNHGGSAGFLAGEGIVQVLLTHGVLGCERLEPVDLNHGPVVLRFRFREVGTRSGDGRLEGLGIDREEQIALFYVAAFAVVHRIEEAGDAGSDLDVFAAAHLAGELGLDGRIAHLDRLDHDRWCHHWRWWSGLAGSQRGTHEQNRDKSATGQGLAWMRETRHGHSHLRDDARRPIANNAPAGAIDAQSAASQGLDNWPFVLPLGGQAGSGVSELASGLPNDALDRAR